MRCDDVNWISSGQVENRVKFWALEKIGTLEID
jgi:hypothetical protein